MSTRYTFINIEVPNITGTMSYSFSCSGGGGGASQKSTIPGGSSTTISSGSGSSTGSGMGSSRGGGLTSPTESGSGIPSGRPNLKSLLRPTVAKVKKLDLFTLRDL